MLARILAEVRAFGPTLTLVVLGHGADDIERALAWADEIRVRNHEPERGLSSSLQVGIDALRALPDPLDGAFIVLGDQPQLEARTMHALAAAATRSDSADRPVIVPRYPAEEARNPVLLLRPAWTWVDELEGDHGLGGLIDDRPDQVLHVAVERSDAGRRYPVRPRTAEPSPLGSDLGRGAYQPPSSRSSRWRIRPLTDRR